MITVADATFKKARRGDLGMELEVEAMASLPTIKAMGWDSKADGSLRYVGMEYVTTSPIKKDDHKKTKLQFLVDSIRKDGKDVQFKSHRTSFHVHRNVSHWGVHMPWNAACAYYLFENLLMKYCGKHREGNQFCLRLKDATSVIDTIKHDIRDGLKKKCGSPFLSLGEADIKYGGQNLKAIANYGSLEYRGMRGELDATVLDTWSSELFDMTEKAANEFKDPAQFMDVYFGHEPLEFASKFFSKEFFAELVKLAGDQASDLITENEPLVCEIAYCADWNRWKTNVEAYLKQGDPEFEALAKAVKKEISRYIMNPVYLSEVPVGGNPENPWWLFINRATKMVIMSRESAELLVNRYRIRAGAQGPFEIEIDRMLKRGAWAPQPAADILQPVPIRFNRVRDDDI